jgi:hypothetical protein
MYDFRASLIFWPTSLDRSQDLLSPQTSLGN